MTQYQVRTRTVNFDKTELDWGTWQNVKLKSCGSWVKQAV